MSGVGGERMARQGCVVAARSWPLLFAGVLSGCAVLPGLGFDVSPDPRVVIRAEREDAEGLARAHVITFLEAARREERASERVLGSRLAPDDRLMLSYRLALAADVDAGQITPDRADRKAADMASRLSSPNEARRNAARDDLRSSVPTAAAPFEPTFDAQATAALPRNVCMGMTFYGIVGTRCALGDK